ncbi:MAG: L-histidine N(alpha)-methyltransferase [Pseudomonadota bacterium]
MSQIKADDPFAADVLAGLLSPEKTISSRWLYDRRGSELFEDITTLEEYYPTRTELAILERHAASIAERIGRNAVLVEYGAGAATKTRTLLSALQDLEAYAPIDISADFLEQTAAVLRREYPGLTVTPIAADFIDGLESDLLPKTAGRRAGFFPGSTIGNMDDEQILSFLRSARDGLGRDACFVLGADLKKSADVLIPAYDDARGVTAAFNLNLLTRINRELGANFDLGSFRHEARWNEDRSRIEMHLVSTKAQKVTLLGEELSFEEGETIHTENSRKFRTEDLERLASQSGWRMTETWFDDDRYFCIAMFE